MHDIVDERTFSNAILEITWFCILFNSNHTLIRKTNSTMLLLDAEYNTKLDLILTELLKVKPLILSLSLEYLTFQNSLFEISKIYGKEN